MKIVLWGMAHDCLPTGHQLRHRQIPADDGQVEYVEHLFLHYPFATAVWDSVKEGIQLRLARKDLRNMKQWIFDFLGPASPVQASALAVTCWHIWESRNDARNERLKSELMWTT
jgi:hypothetical protein